MTGNNSEVMCWPHSYIVLPLFLRFLLDLTQPFMLWKLELFTMCIIMVNLKWLETTNMLTSLLHCFASFPRFLSYKQARLGLEPFTMRVINLNWQRQRGTLHAKLTLTLFCLFPITFSSANSYPLKRENSSFGGKVTLDTIHEWLISNTYTNIIFIFETTVWSKHICFAWTEIDSDIQWHISIQSRTYSFNHHHNKICFDDDIICWFGFLGSGVGSEAPPLSSLAAPGPIGFPLQAGFLLLQHQDSLPPQGHTSLSTCSPRICTLI